SSLVALDWPRNLDAGLCAAFRGVRSVDGVRAVPAPSTADSLATLDDRAPFRGLAVRPSLLPHELDGPGDGQSRSTHRRGRAPVRGPQPRAVAGVDAFAHLGRVLRRRAVVPLGDRSE